MSAPRRLQVLVFNWHEPYICLFAHTGHTFHVVPPPQQSPRRWQQQFRPLPPNVQEIAWPQAVQGVERRTYDLVLCLTLQDVQLVQGWEVPRLFVMLNMIRTDCGLSGAEKAAYVERLRPLFERVDIAFISEKKRRDWGWEAPVVVSGIDPDEYGGYTGDVPRVLRVGNMLRERDHMQGFSLQEEILGRELPSSIIGVNPTVPQARPSRDWEDLKELYRGHRLLLNTLAEEHEDGYNLGVLEAMATGMPVVSTPNSSSPIVDGDNGFVADDPEYLRQKIRLLLADRELAAALGQRARQTVVERFHIRDCAAGWNEVFAGCVERWQERRAGAAAPPPARPVLPAVRPAAASGTGRRLKILLAAPANPLSTSAYYERVLRRGHEVLTCGPRIDQRLLDQWKGWEDQHALKPAGAGDQDKMGLLARLARDCDLPLPWGQVEARQVAPQLPRGWRPDLVVWIDAGADFLLLDPGHFDCPTVCLVGDTHTGQRPWRVEYARQFSRTFLMFVRQDIPTFAQAGCAQVEWLPAACEPLIHRHFAVPKAYDVVFCGQTLRQWHPDRVRLLERLQAAGLDVRVDSKILEEMALLFARGRLVFNRSLNRDLNMRVFEALSCGSMLLTDRLPQEAGLELLFADRQHLVLYGEDDLESLAAYYLEHAQEREEIAAAGLAEALARHTYGHRADQLLARVFGEGVCASCLAEPQPRPAAPAREPELPSYYQNARPELAGLVPEGAQRILDVGCGAGEMGRLLLSRRPRAEVVGVEVHPGAAARAREKLSQVVVGDLEVLEFLPFAPGYFDCIVLGDVLEHFRDPEAVLRKLLQYLSPQGHLVCSVPNVRHQSVLLDLLVNGRWQYRDEGLLDRTHLRFFTLAEIHRLLEQLGLRLEQVTASQSPAHPAMEPVCQAVAGVGGDAEALRRESRVLQYIFRAARAQAAGAAGPRASIVIPVFDQAEFTEQCLYALVRHTGEDPDYEVVVVDNASSDWTMYLLHAFEGDLRVVRNEENLGFARACNQGAGAARGEYLVFLNNDTVPREGWLRALVELADSDPQIGVVGAKLLYPDTGKVQHAGLALRQGVPEHLFRGAEADDPQVSQERDLDMVTGACMLVRRALFQELGGFDEAYLNGVEDVDLCLRARERGYRVVYCPDSVVEHYEGQSAGRFDRVQDNLRRFQERWAGRFDSEGRFAAGPARAVRGNWEGSFFLHSSLALVNRELALALLAGGQCELGLIPFEPHQFGVEEDPERFGVLAARMGRPLAGEVDFHLRHRWPPDFSRPPAGRFVLFQPWEFGRIPKSWVEPLLGEVDQVWAYTTYVRTCYVDSGVPAERVAVVPLGVDPERFRPGLAPLALDTDRRFKFLFVGGTLYRKGIDLLLAAFRAAFSPADDVCLVVKDVGARSFYRDQNAGEQIRRLQQDPSCPRILYLDGDLPGGDLPRLYASCDCLVHPYRGEGFGLPVAEAMACGLPVIATQGGACDDFCGQDTAYLLPSQRRLVRFQEETAGPAWLLEPDLEALQERLRHVVAHPEEARRLGERASAHIRSGFTWKHSAARALEALEQLRHLSPERAGAPPFRGANWPAGTAVIALEGGEAGHPDLAGLPRYDVRVSPERLLGEQLEAIRRRTWGEYLILLGPGGEWAVPAGEGPLVHLQRHPEVGVLGLAAPGPEASGDLVDAAYPDPACLILRRAALEACGGFDEGFQTSAVLANLARCCRRAGWRVALLPGGAARRDPGAGEPEGRELEAVACLEEGDRLREAGEKKQAVVAYRRAVAAKPDFVEAIMVLGEILLELKWTRQGLAVLGRLVELGPDSSRAHHTLGLARQRTGDREGARRSFEKALELQPDLVEALADLGVLEAEQGAVEKGLEYLERAARLQPDHAGLAFTRGLLCRRAGRPDQAISQWREYLQRHPDQLEVKAALAETLVERGDVVEGGRLARQILAVQPDHAQARALLGRVGGREEG